MSGPNFRVARERRHKFIVQTFCGKDVLMMETTHAHWQGVQDEVYAAQSCGRTWRVWRVADKVEVTQERLP